MSSGSEEATATESVDPLIVAEVELDLSRVRSRITDLSTESLAIAADLLAVLSPLHQQVVEVIDLQRVDLRDSRGALELGAGDDASDPPMLELSAPRHAA